MILDCCGGCGLGGRRFALAAKASAELMSASARAMVAVVLVNMVSLLREWRLRNEALDMLRSAVCREGCDGPRSTTRKLVLNNEGGIFRSARSLCQRDSIATRGISLAVSRVFKQQRPAGRRPLE